MKFKFRVTLLTILLSVSGFIVLFLGINSFFNERATAHDLAGQVLDQTALRIYDQLQNRLHEAVTHADLFRRLLESGRLKADDFPSLATIWLEEMQSRAALSRFSIGLAKSGAWLYVRRLVDGRVVIGELRQDPTTGKFGLKDYWPEDYPNKPFFQEPDMGAQDPRRQNWFSQATAGDDSIWTESYLFTAVGGMPEVPGITYAQPVKLPDGHLQAVVTASLDLFQLCSFLQDVPVGSAGFAFVVEIRSDGSRRVVAHPDPTMILHEVKDADSRTGMEIVPAEECKDPRVRAFLTRLPQDLGKHGSRVLAHSFTSEGERFLGSYHVITGKVGPRGVICIVLPEIDVMAGVYRTQLIALGIAASIVLLALLLCLSISGQVARPLEKLAVETDLVGQFHVQPQSPIESVVLEVDQLGRATEAMKSSLRSFRKFVPADLVRKVLASGVEARLGGEERELTIFFCDLAGFTTISEGLSPQALVEQLGEYFRAFTEEVTATGGTVDKFIGDAVMAFWGAPLELPEHAACACRAALRCQRRLAELRGAWRDKNRPEFHARIGINTGPVVVGNIGSEQRLNYTVIGDPVNVASRLEGLNKHYGTAILLSDTTYRAAGNDLVVRPVDWVTVKGKKEGGLVYELLGVKGESATDHLPLIERYSRALDAYRRRDWDRAVAEFEELLCHHSGDGPSEEMLRRCRRFQLTPPAADWDGVFHMESK